jgi:lysozyme family protein
MTPLSPERREEYQRLFRACAIRPEKLNEVRALAARIVAKQDRYRAVQDACGVPWYFVGVVHSLEAGLNFGTHLHNGDPLTGRTVHVPKGRPLGPPPFSWADSALDALQYDGLTANRDWSLAGTLHCLEEYNGTGYRRLARPIPSPYLWSFSNLYERGKFTADHRFDPEAVSGQCGGAALLKCMAEAGQIALEAGADEAPPLGVPVTAPDARYPGRVLAVGAVADPAAVRTLQRRLNEVGCGPIAEDGLFGKRTRAAVQLFQMRHTDAFGRDLAPDGQVGALTWGALFGNQAVPPAAEPADADLPGGALAVAASQLGVRERPPGSNRGPEVEQYQATVGIEPGQPWYAAFVYWCFEQAARQLGRANPVIKTGSVMEHWSRAQQQGLPVVRAEQARHEPYRVKAGTVFVLGTGRGTGHTGLVERVLGGRLVTIEGNTNGGGSREGIGVFRRVSRDLSSINRGFIDYSTA